MRTIKSITLILLLFLLSTSVSAQVRFYFDDFEKWRGWDLQDEFEIDTCLGLGQTDPITPFSGSRVLGSDLSGLGTDPGNHEPSLTSRQCQATSPPIDCRNYTGVHLKFQRWLNIFQCDWDTARIEVSNDGGASWSPLYMNPSGAAVEDLAWTPMDYDISAIADGQADVRIRFSIGGTSTVVNRGGWNVDDFELTGIYNCASTEIDLYDSFESGYLSNWYQDGLDDFDWTILSGPTPSTNTGPDQGFNGSTYYIYTEATGNLNNTSSLISPCLDLSSYDAPVLEFFFHMYCGNADDAMGSMYVDIEHIPGSNIWTPVWVINGNQGYQWIKQVIDLTPYKDNVFRLRIRGVISWGFWSDMAVDQLSIKDELCAFSPMSINPSRTCPGTSVTIDMDQSDASYKWYTAPGGTLLTIGETYTTPVLSGTTTYYVEKLAGSSLDSLKTTFAGGNGHQGVMFNVVAKNTITIDSLDISFDEPAGTIIPVDLYVRSKSYIGSETNPSLWYLHSRDTLTSAGDNVPVRLNINAITLNATDTLAFYLTTTDVAYLVNYTNGSTNFSDTNMTITSGVGKAYPFGTTVSNRMFNGRLYYHTRSLTSQFTVDASRTGFMMQVEAVKAIAIEGFDLHLDLGANIGLALFVKEGDYAGFENDPSAWLRFDSVAAFNPTSGSIIRYNLQNELIIPAGETYSLYLTVHGSTFYYNTGSNMQFENKQLRIIRGTAIDYPFSATYWNNRNLNTRVHYREVSDCSENGEVTVMVPDLPYPNVPDETICMGDSAVLTVPGPAGNYFWWDAPIGGSLLASGNTYTTPNYPAVGTHDFFVEEVGVVTGDTLASTFAAGNSQDGSMFNITALAEDVMIDSLGCVPRDDARYFIEVYYREGGYAGYENDPAAWTLYKRYLFPMVNGENRLVLPMSGLMIPAGTTYGFYVTSVDNNIRYTSIDTSVTDAYITFESGTGNIYPFDEIFTPRTFNGSVYYTVGSTCTSGRSQVTVSVEDCTGISEESGNDHLSIYPNPSDGILNIALDQYQGEVEVTVSSLQGNLLISRMFECNGNTLQQLDLSSLPTGVYLLRTTGNDLQVTKRIVIQ